ncbi:MAG: transcriptional repressor LexA [Spirochaetales bacterium]|nr:transcriptional repressor LexA [Spirochaetales bacterium]
MKDLTEKQQTIFTYVEDFIIRQGYPPTIREIAEEFQITPKGAYDHLRAIEKKGYIKCEKNRSRAIEVLKPSGRKSRTVSADMMEIPLVGRVAAGVPLLADENVEEYLTFPRSMLPSSRVFALRVSGDSMKDAGIKDGDIAVIQKQSSAEDGDIVVALIEDEATLKYFFKEKKRIRLDPANKAFRPIYAQEVQILGKLVGIYRQV